MSIARPSNVSRTHTYLFPFIKYYYGYQLAEFFHDIRPTNSFLGYSENDVDECSIFVHYDEDITAYVSTFKTHPMYVGHNAKDGIVKFKFDNENAYYKFLKGKYSEMYPQFLDTHKHYFAYKGEGGGDIQTYLWQVCKRTYVRLYHMAAVLGVDKEDLGELDSIISINQELFN